MYNSQQKWWCFKYIRAPGLVSKKCPKDSYFYPIGIKEFKRKLMEAVGFYSNQEYFNAESAILERCIYRMKKKFGKEKFFKGLQKVIRSSRIFLQLDVAAITKDLHDITEAEDWEGGNGYMRIPDSCNFEILLLRLQALAKLLQRLITVSQEAGDYLNKKLSTGEFWKIAVICFGIVSRLQKVAINILKYTCDFYVFMKNIYDRYEKYEIPGWIPKDYSFPNDLRDWVGIQWFQKVTQMGYTLEETSIFNFDDMIDEGIPIQDSDDDLEFISEDFVKPAEEDTMMDSSGIEVVTGNADIGEYSFNEVNYSVMLQDQIDDIGEVLDRSQLETNNNNNRKKKKRKKKASGKNESQNELVSVDAFKQTSNNVEDDEVPVNTSSRDSLEISKGRIEDTEDTIGKNNSSGSSFLKQTGLNSSQNDSNYVVCYNNTLQDQTDDIGEVVDRCQLETNNNNNRKRKKRKKKASGKTESQNELVSVDAFKRTSNNVEDDEVPVNISSRDSLEISKGRIEDTEDTIGKNSSSGSNFLKQTELNSSQNNTLKDQIDDIGEVIDRSQLDSSNNNRKRKKKRKINRNTESPKELVSVNINSNQRNNNEDNEVLIVNTPSGGSLKVSNREIVNAEDATEDNESSENSYLQQNRKRTELNNSQNNSDAKKLGKKNKKVVSKKDDEDCPMSIKNISNIRELKEFLRKENVLREKGAKSNCASKKLDKLQWHMLQRSLDSFEDKIKETPNENKKLRKKLFLKAKKHLQVSLLSNS